MLKYVSQQLESCFFGFNLIKISIPNIRFLETSISTVVYKYLQLSNYTIDKKTLELQLLTHPDFPSLKSLSDTFDYFNIENIVAKVPVTALEQLPIIFLSVFKKDNQNRLVLVRKKKDKVQITDENLDAVTLTTEYFQKHWDGTIVGVEELEKKQILHKQVNFQNIAFLFLGFIVLLNLSLLNNRIVFTYTLLSFFGLIISYYIIKESFGIYDSVVSRVCDILSKKEGCSGVINDNKSKLLGSISLSDASIIYYLSNVLILLIIGYHNTILLGVSILGLPIVFYSVYYQGIVLKKWCVLCLAISSILLIQAIFLYVYTEVLSFDFTYFFKCTLLSALVTIIWYYWKKMYKETRRLAIVEKDFVQFKRNKTLFDTLLCKEKVIINDLLFATNKISFGSRQPKVIIYAVTNPLCGFCVESFQIYYKLLKQYDDLQINFIFNVAPHEFTNPASQIVATVLDLYYNHSELSALEGLNEWYANRSLSDWQLKYPIKKDINPIIPSTLEKHQNWIAVNQINYTPETIVNDYKFPKVYKISEITFFIEDLMAENKQIIMVPT